MAELAARLGSHNTHRRAGQTIFQDNFESGIEKWLGSSVGAGGEVAWAAEHSRNGGFSCRMVTGSTFQLRAQIIKNLPYPVLSKIGFELSSTIVGTLTQWYFQITIQDAVNTTIGAIRYDTALQQLQYMDAAGAWQLLAAGVDLIFTVYHFHTFILLMDLRTNLYDSLIVNERTYPMAGLAPQIVAFPAAPSLVLMHRTVGVALSNYTTYVDDVIVTQNEP